MNIRKISATLRLLLLLALLAACASVLFNAPMAVTIGIFGVLLGLASASFLFSLHIGRASSALQQWIKAG